MISSKSILLNVGLFNLIIVDELEEKNAKFVTATQYTVFTNYSKSFKDVLEVMHGTIFSFT